MKKVITVLLILMCAILGGFLYLTSKKEDKVAPVISFPEETVVYEEGTDTAILLEGVRVYDEVDGNVTDTLVVESIIPMDNNQEATVLYYAKDKSNNIAKASRIVTYKKEDVQPWETEPQSEPETAQTEETESETVEETSADGSPHITLTTDKVTISSGESYDLLSYVKNITDDQDGADWLYRQIHIDGMHDISGPGVYELYYTVIDRDGNMSNRAKLTLTIK